MKVWSGGLEEFYTTVCTKDEEDYERESRVIVTAVDLHLTEKEYKRSIILERDFESLKQVLEGKPDKSCNKAKASGRTNEAWHEIKTTQKETKSYLG